jgi:hypothetical protein
LELRRIGFEKHIFAERPPTSTDLLEANDQKHKLQLESKSNNENIAKTMLTSVRKPESTWALRKGSLCTKLIYGLRKQGTSRTSSNNL